MLLQRALRYLRDFLVIIACLLAGKALAALLPFVFPGSILGMLLLFVPVAVGLVAWLEPLRQSFGLIMLCVVLGIVLILGAVGHLYQRMNRE